MEKLELRRTPPGLIFINGQFEAEASDLGLAPGVWPKTIIYSAFTFVFSEVGSPSYDENDEFTGMEYRDTAHGVSLVIGND